MAGKVNIRLRKVSRKSSNLHQHLEASEGFFLLEGAFTLFVGEEAYPMNAGNFAIVRSGEVHRIEVMGEALMLILDNIVSDAEGS